MFFFFINEAFKKDGPFSALSKIDPLDTEIAEIGNRLQEFLRVSTWVAMGKAKKEEELEKATELITPYYVKKTKDFLASQGTADPIEQKNFFDLLDLKEIPTTSTSVESRNARKTAMVEICIIDAIIQATEEDPDASDEELCEIAKDYFLATQTRLRLALQATLRSELKKP